MERTTKPTWRALRIWLAQKRPRGRVIAALALMITALCALVATSGTAAGGSRVSDFSNPLAARTLSGRLMQPFVTEAQIRREARARDDPEYSRRVDAALAEGRVNFLLFGYGETLEPPFARAIMGSYTLVSYDTRSREIRLVSLTHDVRAPEIERVLKQRGSRVGAVKIDQAYDVGGFELMRRTVEDATGLPVDFQVAFRDAVVRDLVDNAFGSLTVDVPAGIDTAPFFLDGRRFEGAHFLAGPQAMSGMQVMQFIKSLEAGADQSVQRNSRKDIVMTSLLSRLETDCSDRALWLKLSALLAGESANGRIAYDFDPVQLLLKNLAGLGSGLPDMLRLSTCGVGMPKMAGTLYIVDPGSGGDGLRWAASDAALNPIARQDIVDGAYQAGGLGVAVPLNGNPYGDLVTDYWGSVRQLVKRTLLGEGH